MLSRNGAILVRLRFAFSTSTNRIRYKKETVKEKFGPGALRFNARFKDTKWEHYKQKPGSILNTRRKPVEDITTFHDVNFILIDFEAIDNNICEFPAIHVRNGVVQNIFHSYCRAPKIPPKRWDKFYGNFFGVSQDFYLKQPTFTTVEWNFCKWAKYNKLFDEDRDGRFYLNQNVAFVCQGNGDFQFLHHSIERNGISRVMRPCYDYCIDLDKLWELADIGELPGTPRMHNMARLQNLEIVSDVHSGIHDTLQLHVVFDFLRKHLTQAKKPHVISGAKLTNFSEKHRIKSRRNSERGGNKR